MDIELSRLRNKKNKAGYQKLESDDTNDHIDTSEAMSNRQARSYGNKGKPKGKGRAKYVDEPEDEVDLLRGDEFAEDEDHAEVGQSSHEMATKVTIQSWIWDHFMLN